eukprot:CAMPEP_0185848496 /NCGR_PEP_ID=MMETSP1354-20130828/3348_1 /TAXON_ID=708628 /ORGANISM="Erythrolobus madagascarensis, Strain CCMP3276" /LENGTH=265 /DNA_ID=CAMNT_0028548899 /DNA_START=1 /DNA_END=798 /DNA_ORIENTATION=+
MTAEELEMYQKEYRRRGVVFVGRLPPRFGPNQLRSLLQKHADVLRIYLAPVDNRDEAGGANRKAKNKKKPKSSASYSHGWVEFREKRDAKKVATLLNNAPMGGNRRTRYYGDLWNLRYLKGFSWNDLSEESAQAKRQRSYAIRKEMSAAAKERDFYLSRVDQAKALESMRARRASSEKLEVENDDDEKSEEKSEKEKRDEDSGDGDDDEHRTAKKRKQAAAPVRYFAQKRAITRTSRNDGPSETPGDCHDLDKNLLGMLFQKGDS